MAKKYEHEEAVKTLNRNGIQTLEYNLDNVIYQYVMDPRDTDRGAGKFLWGILDFIIKHLDFVMISRADFEEKISETRFTERVLG